MSNPVTVSAHPPARPRPVRNRRDPQASPTVAILTLGCKLNLADSEAMARDLRGRGWSVKERVDAGADAVIVNSCSVTHVADAKSRHLVRMARRLAPDARIALTGCMVETASAAVVDALGADLVYRQPAQAQLTLELAEPGSAAHSDATSGGLPPGNPGAIDETLPSARPEPHSPIHPPGFPSARPEALPLVLRHSKDERGGGPGSLPKRAFRTRAFVAAQEGCNDVCAFCIVPKTRGRERSKSVESIVAEVRAREAEGVQEVVITGTQLGAWGREQGRRGLYPVLKALLDQTSVPRIRMSSVQPQDLSPEMVGLWADSRLCRHFHLALQSGSRTVLERMRRRYSAQQYSEAVGLLRREIPGVAITTDVIAGFPGETEAEFEETLAFCREMAFAGMHVFPYSQRTGTAAAKMPAQVPEQVKKGRVRRLLALAAEMAARYRRGYAGTEQSVLWESAALNAGGATVWEGLTDTYMRVFAESEADIENQIAPASIAGLCEGGVSATIPAIAT